MTFESTRRIFWAGLLIGSVSAAHAQTDRPRVVHRVTHADRFIEENEGSWRVVRDPVTKNPRFLYGGRLRLATPPSTPPQFETAARLLVDTHPELFGFPSHTLELRDNLSLPLSQVGSSDKVAVVFDQSVESIPVLGASVTVLFEAATGDVIGIDTTGVPGVEEVELVPRSTAVAAHVVARERFRQRYGATPTDPVDPEIGILGPAPLWGIDSLERLGGPRLVWYFDLSSRGRTGPSGEPAHARVIVEAGLEPTVLRVLPLAHAIEGRVRANVNIGKHPGTPNNQEQTGLPHVWIRKENKSGKLLATTDADGRFAMKKDGPIPLFTRLEGPWARVAKSPRFKVPDATSEVPVDILFNPDLDEYSSAEVSGFYWVNRFHDWWSSVAGDDDQTLNHQLKIRANSDEYACNAYYWLDAITLMRAHGYCNNTAYRDIILHETGHWAVERYNKLASGSFHEGIADVFTYFITDQPNLLSPAICCDPTTRTALQEVIFKCPIDGDESCHSGAYHTEGQALASALWAVRERLNETVGDEPGDLVADRLLVSWLATYDDVSITNSIRDHWIALDDDDGDLSNLTPHFSEINDGFQSYGWSPFATMIPGDIVQGMLEAPDAVDEVLFPAVAGMRLSMETTMLSGNASSLLTIFAPDGIPVASFAPDPSEEKNVSTVTLSESGTFRLRIQVGSGEKGGYQIRTSRQLPPDAKSVVATESGEEVVWTKFTALAGSTLKGSIELVEGYGGVPFMYLARPGYYYADLSWNADGDLFHVMGTPLPMSGEYVVVVVGGSYNEKQTAKFALVIDSPPGGHVVVP